MCACTPCSDSPSARCTRANASPACSIEKPNFESAWPVEIFSCVSPRTSGVTRTSTCCSPPRARAPREQTLQALDLVEVVEHDQPNAALQRHAQLGLGLGVAVQHDALGRKARVQREVQLAAGGHVAPQPLLREQRQHRRAGKRLGGEHHVQVLVALAAAGRR